MILDSSAIIAVLKRESEAGAFTTAIEAAEHRRVSAANFLEAAIVMDSKRDPAVSRLLDDLLHEAEIEIVGVDERQARVAREAYRDFGRGSGHPARLNFGDCFAYALAKVAREPLLYKGDDFSHTDVTPALR